MKLLSRATTSFLFLGLLGCSNAQRGYGDSPEDAKDVQTPPTELPNDADPSIINDPSRDGPIRAEPKPNNNVEQEAAEAEDNKTVRVGINTTQGSSVITVKMEEADGFWGSMLKGREKLEPGLKIYGAIILEGQDSDISCNAIKLVGETGWGQAGTIAGVPFGSNSKRPHSGIDAIECSVPRRMVD